MPDTENKKRGISWHKTWNVFFLRLISQNIEKNLVIFPIYRYIKLNKRKIYTPELLSYKINNELLNSAKIRIILDVMQELDIMSVSSKEDEYYIAINDNGKKVNLKDSQILSNISKNDITG